MLCLRSVSGLPLDVDVELERLVLDDVELNYTECRHVPLSELIPSLLNKSLRYPEDVYSQHRSIKMKQHSDSWPTGYDYDVYFVPSGLLGIEYCKTHVFKTASDADGKVSSFIQILSGSVTVLLQRNEANTDPYALGETVAVAQLIELQEGDKLAIPAGYYYTFINTGEEPVVFARFRKKEHIVDPFSLTKHNGLAYYLISKNARREIVSNPKYRYITDLEEVKNSEINQKLNYQANDKPLYEELLSDINSYTSVLAT